MTISKEGRKAGPFEGNGSAAIFPFEFKVFQTDDLLVVHADTDGVESTLIYGQDYAVTLNPNQDTAPGGSVVLLLPLGVGALLVVTSNVRYLQPTNLTNLGGFYPEVINSSMDRLTILSQQNAERLSRAVVVPITDERTPTQFWGDLLDDVGTSEENAAASADLAKQYKNNASGSAEAAADAVTQIRNLNYGPLPSDPTQRPDGSPRQEGDQYFNTTSVALKTFNGSMWFVPNVDGQALIQELAREDSMYGAGIVITRRNQTFWRDGVPYRAGAVLELPYTTTGDWAAEEGLFVAVGDQVLRQELASPEGVLLVGGALRSIGSAAQLKETRGRFVGEQVSLVEFGGGAVAGVGGGTLEWRLSGDADDGAVFAGPEGFWHRQVSGEIEAGWYGLPLQSGFCYDEIEAIEAYCFNNKVGVYFGPGIYDVGPRNWPFRNPEVPPTSLKDYGGVVIRASGPGSVFKTTSDGGADVLQVNAVKGLSVIGYPTITATLNSFEEAGSNGLSMTFGGEDLYFELNCIDLPFVDKGNYGDGGKAFTLQTGLGNSLGYSNIVLKGSAKNVLYGFGIDADYDNLIHFPMSGISIDLYVEDAYRAYVIGLAAPTTPPPHSSSLPYTGVTGKIVAKNCQQYVVDSRGVGASVEVEVLSDKPGAELRKLPSDTLIYVSDIRGCKYATYNIHGVVTNVDNVLRFGGAAIGSGVTSNSENVKLNHNVVCSSASKEIDIVNFGGQTATKCIVILDGAVGGHEDLLTMGANTVYVNGNLAMNFAAPGDASYSVRSGVSDMSVVYSAPITAVRTVGLPAIAKPGDRVKTSRLAAATGSTLSFGGLTNLAASTWAEATFILGAWRITATGSV